MQIFTDISSEEALPKMHIPPIMQNIRPLKIAGKHLCRIDLTSNSVISDHGYLNFYKDWV